MAQRYKLDISATQGKFSSTQYFTSRAVAAEAYRKARENLQPGQRAQLYDSRNGVTLGEHYVRTVEEWRAHRLEYLTHWLESQVSKRSELIEFANKVVTGIDDEATHPFSWADDAFSIAAQVEVALSVQTCLAAHMSLQDIHRSLSDQFMRLAQFPSRSSSTCTNIINVLKVAAAAEALEHLQRALVD